MKKLLFSLLLLITTCSILADSLQFDCLLNHYSKPDTRMMHRFRTNISTDSISVSNLPVGLKYNPARHLVEGKISTPGVFTYQATATRGKIQITETVTVTVSNSLISPTPLMGWMSWNIFQDKISETNIKEVADLLVSTGLKEAGFNYVLIDDHWHASSRDADGYPVANAEKFPGGMKQLVDYIHSRGLKAGTYSDAANKTCGGEFGSYGFEVKDAQKYAEWGFDFLKYDYCFAPDDVEEAKKRYKTMSDALKSTGRPFFFNICEWGARKPWLWAASAGGHAWRATWDSRDTWDHGAYNAGRCGVVQTIDVMKHLAMYAGPNQFNDADMMCVGLYGKGKPSSANGAAGMNDREYQAQFAMWSMFASPLLISFDISNMNEATKNILTNKEVIAINQDPMGQQAELIYSADGNEIYSKELENGDVAVAFLNRNATSTTMEISLSNLHIEKRVLLRDLITKKNIGKVKDKITATVESHEVKLYRVKKL